MVVITQHNLWRVQDARYPACGYSRLHAHSPDSPSAAPRTALGLLIPKRIEGLSKFCIRFAHAEPVSDAARGRCRRHRCYMEMVPAEGIEPPTFGLQNRCFTAELSRRTNQINRLSEP